MSAACVSEANKACFYIALSVLKASYSLVTLRY